MLNVSNNYKNKVFSSNYLQWEYNIDIEDVGSFDNTLIKSVNVSGQLQSSFTLGSSLNRTMDLELLISENTEIPENSLITFTTTLIIYDAGTTLPAGTTIYKGIEVENILSEEDYVLDYDLILTKPVKESVLIGKFYITNIDRETIGRIKINASDAMGHTEYLASSVKALTTSSTVVNDIIDDIAKKFNLGFTPIQTEEILSIDNLNKVALSNYTYRQFLEYLAGYCGYNIKIDNNNCIKLFKFEKVDDFGSYKDKQGNIKQRKLLSKDNYYKMTKGQYLFSAKGIMCNLEDNANPIIFPENGGKDSEMIKMANPFMTINRLGNIYHHYCNDGSNDKYVNYYPITMEALGTCLFETGDIVTVHDHYNNEYDLYIQDHKLSCQNGLKESFQSFFDFNKGSIANSISGKVQRLALDLATTKEEFADHYVSNTDFELVLNELDSNYAVHGLDKWLIEYYELSEDNTNYGIESIITKTPIRKEIIEDADSLVATNIKGNTLCRFFTSVYVEPLKDKISQKIKYRSSDGAIIHLNGNVLNPNVDSTKDSTMELPYGWNLIEILVGGKGVSNITTWFKIKWENAPLEDANPYYHMTDRLPLDESLFRYVVINYVDLETGNQLQVPRELQFNKGDTYNISYEADRDSIDNCRFVKIEGESSGTIEDNISVTFYYLPNNKFFVNTRYLDWETKEEIHESISEILAEGTLYNIPQEKHNLYIEGYRRYFIRYNDIEYDVRGGSSGSVYILTDITIDVIYLNANKRLFTTVYFDRDTGSYLEMEKDRDNPYIRTVNLNSTIAVPTEKERILFSPSSNMTYHSVTITMGEDFNESFLLNSDTMEITVTDDIYANVRYFYHVFEEDESTSYNLNNNLSPALDDNTSNDTEIKDKEKTEVTKTQKRYEYIAMVNPYATTIDYSRITEVERLTTPNSIIDRVLTKEIITDEGSEKGIDIALGYSTKYSEVLQEVDNITQTVSTFTDKVTEQEGAMSEIKQEVDNVGFTFTSYSSGNYISNSAFNTDFPLKGFTYSTQYDYANSLYSYPYPEGVSVRPKYDFSNFYYTRLDGYTRDSETDKFTVTRSVGRYTNYLDLPDDGDKTKLIGTNKGDIIFGLDLPASGEFINNVIDKQTFEILDVNNKDSYPLTNSKTLKTGSAFLLGQTLKSKNENFPIIYRDGSNVYQFYMSAKIKSKQNMVLRNKCQVNRTISRDIEYEFTDGIVMGEYFGYGKHYYYINNQFKVWFDADGNGHIELRDIDSNNIYSLRSGTITAYDINGNSHKTFSYASDGIMFNPPSWGGEGFSNITYRIKGRIELEYQERVGINVAIPHLYMSVTFGCSDNKSYTYNNFGRRINCNLNMSDDYPHLQEDNINYDYKLLDKIASNYYAITTEWQQKEFFIDIPAEIIKKCTSIKTEFGILYSPEFIKGYPAADKLFLYHFYNDLSPYGYFETPYLAYYTKNEDRVGFSYYEVNSESDNGSFFIADPMLANTRDNLSVPYTEKNAELITGATNITQDGITISRSDSLVTTEIKNNGMAVLYDGNTVAQFKEHTTIPTLDVTKKLTAPNIFINARRGDGIPDIIEVCEDFSYDDPDVGSEFDKELKPKYVYFNELQYVLENYSFIKKDRLVIHVKAGSQGKGLLPYSIGGVISPFILENIKCGIIEILFDKDVVLKGPLLLRNIEGTVRVRGPISKKDIKIDSKYFLGEESTSGDITEFIDCAPVIPCIFAHNVRWLEIYGINFSGGNDFPSYNGGEPIYYDNVKFKTLGDLQTKLFNKSYFSFSDCTMNDSEDPNYANHPRFETSGIYANATIEELNNILNTCAIFIGYCNLVEVSRCNFPKVTKNISDNYNTENYYKVGVYGDHSDCYLFNNQGTLGQYYLNRDKCWFRLPVKENVTDDDWEQVMKPDETTPQDKVPGYNGNKIESQVTTNESGNKPGNDSGEDTDAPILPDKDNTYNIDLFDQGIYPAGLFRKDSSNYFGLSELYTGTSDDMIYLGCLTYNGAESGTFDTNYFKPGSNLTGYSRMEPEDVPYAPTHSDPSSLTGYDIDYGTGSYGSYWSMNKSYYGYYQESILINNLGFSIAIPDLTEELESKEILSAKIELEFYNEEYGNQYGNKSLDVESDLSPVGSIAFGARLVYGNSHHYESADGTWEEYAGYNNMGTTSWWVEFLKEGNAFNLPYLYGYDTYNFSEPDGGRPFVVGKDPRNGFTLKETIDISTVNYESVKSAAPEAVEYLEQRTDNPADDMNPQIIFNGLNALKKGLLKYVDIAPVYVNAGSEAVPTNNVSDYNYNGKTSQFVTSSDLITRTVSCFKLKSAKLVVKFK